jgi:putative endonuclease
MSPAHIVNLLTPLAENLLQLSSQDRQERGVIGERMAQLWLTELGIQVIAHNVRYRLGELDLIGQFTRKPSHSSISPMPLPSLTTIVFIEVRLRQHSTDAPYGGALESITPHKQRKWHRAAQTWLQQHYGNQPPPCRFDAVTIDLYPRPPLHSVTHVHDIAGLHQCSLCRQQVQLVWHQQVL